jgi:hypothetical protein
VVLSLVLENIIVRNATDVGKAVKVMSESIRNVLAAKSIVGQSNNGKKRKS